MVQLEMDGAETTMSLDIHIEISKSDSGPIILVNLSTLVNMNERLAMS